MKRRGHTLVEVLVAASLMALILGSVYAMWSLIGTTATRQETRMQMRAKARDLMANLSTSLQRSAYVWVGTPTSPTLQVGGTVYSIPAITPVMSATGSSLVFCLPDNLNSPANAVPGPLSLQATYTVITAVSQPMAPADPLNPGALSIVLQSFPGVSPATANEPASIDLTSLNSAVVQTWDVYLDRNHPVWVGIEDPRAVFLDFWVTYTPVQGPPQAEHMSTLATLRNSN